MLKTAHALSVCDAIRDRLLELGIDPRRITTHYIGVSTSAFPYHQRKPVRAKVADGDLIEFLQIGRFVEKKGQEYTIKAFAEFVKGYCNASLTLAGDGPLLDYAKALVSQAGLSDRVAFPGAIGHSEVRSYLFRSDALLYHSVTASDGDQEGVPIGIMEAMATGLPVVATNHSGIPELVDDGITGLIVEERDIAGYVTALTRLCDCGLEMGQRARVKIENKFALDTQNLTLRQIYRSLIRDGALTSGTSPPSEHKPTSSIRKS